MLVQAARERSGQISMCADEQACSDPRVHVSVLLVNRSRKLERSCAPRSSHRVACPAGCRNSSGSCTRPSWWFADRPAGRTVCGRRGLAAALPRKPGVAPATPHPKRRGPGALWTCTAAGSAPRDLAATIDARNPGPADRPSSCFPSRPAMNTRTQPSCAACGKNDKAYRFVVVLESGTSQVFTE